MGSVRKKWKCEKNGSVKKKTEAKKQKRDNKESANTRHKNQQNPLPIPAKAGISLSSAEGANPPPLAGITGRFPLSREWGVGGGNGGVGGMGMRGGKGDKEQE